MKQKRAHVHEVISAKYPPHEAEHGQEDHSADQAKIIIYEAIESHMEYISPYKTSWPNALAVIAEPSQLPQTLLMMTDTVDDICHLAGMNSSRLDWYTDRGLVLMVFGTTEMYMLTDYSDKMQDTREFLRKNVEFWRANMGLFQALRSHTSVIAALSSAWEKIVTGVLSEQSRRAWGSSGSGSGAEGATASSTDSSSSSSSNSSDGSSGGCTSSTNSSSSSSSSSSGGSGSGSGHAPSV
jgi:rpsU-divergently transcribed protein